MTIKLIEQTEKFTGKKMHFIYVDDKFITCKTDRIEADKAFEEAKQNALLFPFDREEVVKVEVL